MIPSRLRQFLVSKGYQMTDFDVIQVALRINSCCKEVSEILLNYKDLVNGGYVYDDKYESVLCAYSRLIDAYSIMSSLAIEVEKC